MGQTAQAIHRVGAGKLQQMMPTAHYTRRTLLAAGCCYAALGIGGPALAGQRTNLIIDDLTKPHPETALGTSWRFAADTVMGGVSKGAISREEVSGQLALRLQGDVSLDNNGGFIQAALPLATGGETFDASHYAGIELSIYGNNQDYSLHLRTDELTRPWQSYRSVFTARPEWQTLRFPFKRFKAYRTDVELDMRRLVRLGLVAIGREFRADLAVNAVSLYKD